ncbi:hypothetical protein C1645_830425 [Glomus cerebriforme]|uniref:Uncharacterized protein n=1 Tax=Glomus cerebriforme TaxID=658196 RepID=A0A397SHG9_9GLOM|nr:hypothetical protein C1645_830425 [Glomus cerebriforme]
MGSPDYAGQTFVLHIDRTFYSFPPFLGFLWNNVGPSDLTITFFSYFSLDAVSRDPSSPLALLFTYIVSFLTEELLANASLLITIQISYLHCLHSVCNSIPFSLPAYSIINNFLKSYAVAGFDSSLLM